MNKTDAATLLALALMLIAINAAFAYFYPVNVGQMTPALDEAAPR